VTGPPSPKEALRDLNEKIPAAVAPSYGWAASLITAEDNGHVHKLLGVSCLLHYGYRFTLCGEQDMGFDGSNVTLLCLGLHLSLSLSSLLFRIPLKRIKEGSRIWPEYRLHSIVFASRSLAVMLLFWFERQQHNGLSSKEYWFVNPIIVFGALLMADIASRSCGENRSSTIQELDAPPSLRFFFSVMQFHATMGVLFGVRRFSTQFVYVWIIQFTAFLMTLRRKNLLPHGPLVKTYGIMLLFGLVVSTYDLRMFGVWRTNNILANGAVLLRLGLGCNKYLVWGLMTAACMYLRGFISSPAGLASGGMDAFDDQGAHG